MIPNRPLPQWLHRLACGMISAAFTATAAIFGTRYSSEDSWWHTAFAVLLWLSIPVGGIFASVAHRFSIVEGCAGEVGYEDLESAKDDDER